MTYINTILKNWSKELKITREDKQLALNVAKLKESMRVNSIKKNVIYARSLLYFLSDEAFKELQNSLINSVKCGVTHWKEQPKQPEKPIKWLAQREKDLNEYQLIDKRVKYNSLGLFDIIKKLYASGKLSKNQYKKALLYLDGKKAFLSEDTVAKCNVYVSHIGKNNTQKRATKNKIEYITIKKHGVNYKVKLKATQKINELEDHRKVEQATKEFNKKIKKDNKFTSVLKN